VLLESQKLLFLVSMRSSIFFLLLLVVLMSYLGNNGVNQTHGNLFHFSSKGFKILDLTFMSDIFLTNFCVYCE
jgi:hypothetical protein